jgi:hypothetical protein
LAIKASVAMPAVRTSAITEAWSRDVPGHLRGRFSAGCFGIISGRPL